LWFGLLFCFCRLFGGVGEWTTFTSKREIRDLAIDSRGIVWAATSGGMFSYNPSDSTFQQFTTSEGLKTIDLTAITIDDAGAIWVGAQNGFLHRFNPQTFTWSYVSDIALRTDPFKRINALQTSGDTLYILSDIGVSRFSISKQEFGDTYMRFGADSVRLTGNVTSLRMFNGTIWVGTRSGLASTPVTNPNPSVPESWQVWTASRGLSSNTVNGLAINHDSVFAATQNGISVFDGSAWYTVGGTSGLNVLGVTSGAWIADTTFFVTPDAAWSYVPGSSTPVQLFASAFPSSFSTIRGTTSGGVAHPINKIYLGTIGRGLDIIRANSTIIGSSIAPPGPPSNNFVSVAVDQRGVVWAATGVAKNEGFMSFNGSKWKSYTTAQDSRLGNDNYWNVSIGRNNSKWIGNWGGGVALLDDQGVLQKVFNTSNGLSPTLPNDPAFVVVGGVATDPNGLAWITNRTGSGDTALVTFAPDSSLGYVGGITTRSPLSIFEDLVIDENRTKWFTNFSRFESVFPVGLYYYNERFKLPGTNNFGWGLLTTNDGLTTNKIYSLAVGQDGDVWVGSDEGISIIFNPGSPRAIHPFHPLRDQIIQTIVVDPLNNKWIGTRQGVFVLSSDGTSILNRYTVENTDGKLLDDDVASLAIDERTGTVYFGTEKGLSSLSTPAAVPNRSFGELSFAPNPLYVPSSGTLTIDGLVQNSLIKILSIDGNLIKEIRSPGGRIGFWDGTDTRGNIVGTGVYLVVAYSEDGSKVATGKLAVIRR
jgi:ligand-binding sensor domain-containing protein